VELRGKDLSPHVDLLQALMVSPVFPKALTQLLFTLEGTASAVAELGLECAERFLATHREEIGDIRTAAAADSRHVGELLLRTYAQSEKPGGSQRLTLLTSFYSRRPSVSTNLWQTQSARPEDLQRNWTGYCHGRRALNWHPQEVAQPT
jgi:hypothetical protein